MPHQSHAQVLVWLSDQLDRYIWQQTKAGREWERTRQLESEFSTLLPRFLFKLSRSKWSSGRDRITLLESVRKSRHQNESWLIELIAKVCAHIVHLMCVTDSVGSLNKWLVSRRCVVSIGSRFTTTHSMLTWRSLRAVSIHQASKWASELPKKTTERLNRRRSPIT